MKFEESGFSCNSAVSAFRFSAKQILHPGSNYGSAGKGVMHMAARPFSPFLKCHVKI